MLPPSSTLDSQIDDGFCIRVGRLVICHVRNGSHPSRVRKRAVLSASEIPEFQKVEIEREREREENRREKTRERGYRRSDSSLSKGAVL